VGAASGSGAHVARLRQRACPGGVIVPLLSRAGTLSGGRGGPPSPPRAMPEPRSCAGISVKRRHAVCPRMRALEGGAYLQDREVIAVPADDLERHGQALSHETAG